MKKTALVTAIGSFSADITIKTLHALGFTVIGCDIYPASWVADSANVDAFYQVPLVRDQKAYLDTLYTICREREVSYLLPSIDLEVDLLNEHREDLAALGVTLCLSSYDAIRCCRDKYLLFQAVKPQGAVRVIPTSFAKDVDPASLSYPVIVKPADGRSSEGCHVVEDAGGFAYFTGLMPGRKLLVQPKISGYVITVDVVCDGERVACVARRELLRTGNGAGTTVQIIDPAPFEAFCTKTALSLGIRGAVNFEFIENSDGYYYFLEINPRFAGGVKFSHIAGYPVVEEHMKCFMGQSIDPAPAFQSMIIARKYEEFIME